MLTQTPTTKPTPPPTPAPLNRWAGMPAMSGFFLSGDPLLDLRDRFDRVFDGVFGGAVTPAGWFGRAETLPEVDVVETDTALTLTAELPGVGEKDIALTVAGRVLTLAGERRIDTDTGDPVCRIVERGHDCFTRSFQLPEEVEVDKITARFDRGVLTVTLPKAERPAPAAKRIAIGDGTV